MVERRDILKLALGGIGLGLFLGDFENLGGAALAAQPEAVPVFGFSEPEPFNEGMVHDMAKALAKDPYRPQNAELPEALRNLNYEQYASIRNKSGTAIWANENLGFSLEPLNRGFIFSMPMQINLVAQGETRRLIYNPAAYDFGRLQVPGDIGDIGFSGFRVLVTQDKNQSAEVATFQGASFFRAVARGQNPGTMARALSIKTADPRGEEFPAIRKVWIERPSLADNALTILALIDSESVTGAYRFTLHPGDAMIIDTECTLFARVNVDNFGLAAMSATHLFDGLDLRKFDDFRPEVAEISGLSMLTGAGEWLWRPVSNRETLQISTFLDDNPKGFGFLQRDRDFAHYLDDVQHWEARPSLWIEPIGEWAEGVVELVEIPSDSEVNDNIIAFWKPHLPLLPGSETPFAYRQFWWWNPPEHPDLAIVTLSRQGHGSSGKKRRFLVEFSGDVLAHPDPGTGGEQADTKEFKPNITASRGTISAMRTALAGDQKSCRTVFELDPGNETSCEMRLVLERNGRPISETWLYRWTP